MNPLNFATLKQQLGILIDGNANNALSWIGDKVNDAYIDLCNMFRLDAGRRTIYLQLTAPYTTGTVSVNAQGTTVTGSETSFTGNMIGQTILLNGQVYEISAVASATSLTINRPYEGSSNLTNATIAIYYDAYDLPWGCDYTRIIHARDPYNQQILKVITKEKFDRYFPNPTNVGTPAIMCPLGYIEARYPAIDGNTATSQATTTTTTVVMPAGVETVDDYYNDWMLINTTRNAVSRVTDYVGSTKTLTVSPAITGQTTGDVVYLKKRIGVAKIYPMPGTAQAIELMYYVDPDRMVNNYDVPWAVPDRYHRAIYLRAASHGALIRDDGRKREVDHEYNKILTEMASEFNFIESEGFNKESIDESCRADEPNIYQYPLGV